MKPIVFNSPSIANSNMLELSGDIESLIEGGAKFLHVDLMDGHYVPNLCFPLRVISDIKERYPEIVIDLHMMVADPISYVPRVSDAGADYVSFHSDSTPFVIRTVNAIRSAGMKPGIVINPSQGVDVIRPYAKLLDMVTLMAVEPGFAGQQFMPDAIGRVLEAARIRKEMSLEFLINVDGAINKESVIPCVRNGANVLVTGIFTVFRQPEGIVAACKKLERQIGEAFKLGFNEDAY